MGGLTYRRPRLLGLILAVLVVAGALALGTVGRQEDPSITGIYASVTTRLPGADPARVEALVAVPLEERLRELAAVDLIESASLTGVSILTIELDHRLDGAALDQARSELRDAVGEVALPRDALPPDVITDEAGAFAAVAALIPERPGVGLATVARQAEAVADRLRDVPGTRKVTVIGAPAEEVLVTADVGRLAALGLTADDLARAVEGADAKVRAGRLRGAGSDLVIEVEGAIGAPGRLRDVILREGPDGAALLGDVAEITRGPRDPPDEAAWVDGARAVLVAARIEDGRQVDRWMGGVRAALEEAGRGLTEGVGVEVVFDQSRHTLERLAQVGGSMALGAALVVGVLFVTMGWRSALIVALVLPLVSLATVATMSTLRVPVEQMSVSGLVVALGLLVDAAIVMTDEIGRRLREGLDRPAAVEDAVGRLLAPLVASTVTTALAFAPMILLPGPSGDFVGSIAVAVVAMLGWSLAVAILVTPALAGRLLPWGEGRPPGPLGRGLARAGRRSLALALEHPVRAVALSLVLPAMGFAALPGLEAQFFPPTDRDQFHVEVEMPRGTAHAETMAVTERIAADILARPEVIRVIRVTGRSAPSIYYNMLTAQRAAPAFGQLLVTTRSPRATDALLPRLQAELPRRFPEARVLPRGFVQGPAVSAPVELRIAGPDLRVLRRLGEEARAVMREVPAVTAVRASIDAGAPQVRMALDEARVRRVGLTLRDASRQMEAALEGATGGTLVEGTEEIPVRVRLGGPWRSDLAALADLPIVVPSEGGELAPAVPLSALGELRVVPQATPITRRDGERTQTVQAFVAHGVLPQEALGEVRRRLEASGLAVPPGYRLEWGGDADARAETLADLTASLPLVALAGIATVVLTFDSLRLAGVVAAVAGLSAGLSLLSLAVLGFPFGINAVVGVIGSIGVSVNAAIIILTGLQRDPRSARGDREAMAEVVAGSSRHILSTTITTFGGFVPLLLAGGGFWPPFATAVAGGVLLSTAVSFYFTPPMFALLARRPPDESPAEAGAEPGRAEDPLARAVVKLRETGG